MRFTFFTVTLLLCLTAPIQSAWGRETLRILYTYEGANIGQLLEGFGKEHDVDVQAEYQQQSDLKSTIMAMMELKTVPDAIIIPADHMGMYHFTNYSEVDPSLFKADIPSRLWISSSSDGKLYGAPLMQGNHLVLYYNKQFVTQSAMSWEDLRARKTTLEAKGIRPIIWYYSEPYWFLPFLAAYGGWPIDDGQPQLATPAMAAALTFYRKLRDLGSPPADCDYQCTVDMFKEGRVAYTITGDWEGNALYAALGENLGVAAIPSAEGHQPLSTFSTHVISFPRSSLEGPKRKRLIQLVDYLQSPRVQRELWTLGAIPVESTAFTHARANASGYSKDILELMQDTRPLPAEQAMTFIWDAIDKGLIRHNEGVMDSKSAALYMQRLAERHMRNIQKPAGQAEAH